MKKNGIKSDFKEIVLKFSTNDRSDKMFLLTLKFRPQGVVSPCPGAIYMYKTMKKIYKIRLKRFFFFFFKLVANDKYEIALKASFPFSHYKPMETLSCHSDESTSD